MARNKPEEKQEEPTPAFIVEAKQFVELRIPKSLYTGYGLVGGPVDFVKTFSMEEAKNLSAALKSAAQEIE